MRIDVTFQEINQRIPVKMAEPETMNFGAVLDEVMQVPSESDHAKLTNRDAPDQHPIEAITRLQTELDSKLAGGGFLSNLEIQKILDS